MVFGDREVMVFLVVGSELIGFVSVLGDRGLLFMLWVVWLWRGVIVGCWVVCGVVL